ncbi:MAG: hypothetical protein WA874_04100 [Chryseosolibacter sp.]
MEVHFGFIRDKQRIHAGLMNSKSSNHQVAICYSSEGKLLVKICTVVDVTSDAQGATVTLRTQQDDPATELRIPVDQIQSIYTIRDFDKDE